MKNIMVTDYCGEGEAVCIFTDKLSTEQVRAKLKEKQQSFTDIFEVQTCMLQYYIYEPCYI
jgi:hypothetical protein